MDTIQETPRNKRMGILADALRAANDYAEREDRSMPMGKANPVLSVLAKAMALRSAANVADDLSYGRAPIKGSGMTTALNDDAKDVALMALPFPKASAKTAMAMHGVMDAAPGVEKAAIVWHGSPHKFDRFDASKIGTGEGAQAYGHGLYLAEAPDVAKNYAPRDLDYENKLMALYKQMERNRNYDAMDVLESAMMHSTPQELRSLYGKGAEQVIKQIESIPINGSSLYKVDLPDETIARMVDWDKPINEQNPAVIAMLEKAGINTMSTAQAGPMARGQEAHLSKFGIPGIRYLDEASRSAGKGTSNFVVFPGEEDKLRILERNGQLINALRNP